MKKFTVRAFVLALAITGAAATTVSQASTTSNHRNVLRMTEPGSPAPVCAPNSGDHCGMD